MKFTITKESFLNGLQQVQSVISTHSTLAILFNVLIKAEKQKLSLVATDMNVSMRWWLGSQFPPQARSNPHYRWR